MSGTDKRAPDGCGFASAAGGPVDELDRVDRVAPPAGDVLDRVGEHFAFLDRRRARQVEVNELPGAGRAGHVEAGEVSAQRATPTRRGVRACTARRTEERATATDELVTTGG